MRAVDDVGAEKKKNGGERARRPIERYGSGMNEAFSAATSNAGRARIASSILAGVSALDPASGGRQDRRSAVATGDPLLDLLSKSASARHGAPNASDRERALLKAILDRSYHSVSVD